MILADIPNGVHIFADANILSYALSEIEPFSEKALILLKRASRRELYLFTSSMQAAHVIHRAMIVEARREYQLSSKDVISYLKKHPRAVRSLTRYKEIPGEFTHSHPRCHLPGNPRQQAFPG